jgi:hypothetical protein
MFLKTVDEEQATGRIAELVISRLSDVQICDIAPCASFRCSVSRFFDAVGASPEPAYANFRQAGRWRALVITVPAGVRIYLACRATDMHKGFDSLSGMAQEVLKQDPSAGHLFAFRSM